MEAYLEVVLIHNNQLNNNKEVVYSALASLYKAAVAYLAPNPHNSLNSKLAAADYLAGLLIALHGAVHPDRNNLNNNKIKSLMAVYLGNNKIVVDY